MDMRTILLINGPNLDMLGTREPEVYGSQTLADIEMMVATYADERGVMVSRFQSNSEGDLINVIHHAPDEFDGVIYNPGAHTHYSYALRDAIASVSIPVVEVHISDVEQREEFRRTSVIAPVCVAQVKGLGIEGYCRAVDILCNLEEPVCLGEGYQERFEPGSNIFVAGLETASAALLAVGAKETEVLVDECASVVAEETTPQPDDKAIDVVLEGDDEVESASGEKAEATSEDEDGAEIEEAFADETEEGLVDQIEQGPESESESESEYESEHEPEGEPVFVEEIESESKLDSEPNSEIDTELESEPGSESGQEQVQESESEIEPEPEPEPEPELEPKSAPIAFEADELPDDEDFAQPYAEDVAAVDVEMLAWARQQLLRNANIQMGVDAFLVRDTANIKWLTALDDVFDEERAHALLVTERGAYLHTDSRYANAIRTQLQKTGVSVSVSDERVGHMDFARSVLTDATGAFEGRVAIEDSMTYADYVKAVKALGISSLVASTDVVLGLRAVKTNAELSRMLAAQAVTDAAFVHIVQFMRPGMTEREVQLELEDYMLRHGGEGLAFSSIVATGANGADPHAIPGKAKLEAGQCVVMDFGAKAFGYCSDMTRMVFLGQPDVRLADAYEVLRRANETVEAALRPGMTGKQAHELAERVLAEGGYAGSMGHGLGHGVGLEVHEQPVLNARNERPLVMGNVVTVEPGIYVPGEFGMRLEDCGVVNDNGFEAFSQLGHDMVIL